MTCQKCNSGRIAFISAKCRDSCIVVIGKREFDGYPPTDIGVGGGSYVSIQLCLHCGQVQGTWPLAKAKLEQPLQCPDGCGYEGMPEDNDSPMDYRYKYKCPKCGEQRSAKDWCLV